MKLIKLWIAVISVLALLAGCSNQASNKPAQNPPSNNSGNPSDGSKGNSGELGPGADVEQTMPDVVK